VTNAFTEFGLDITALGFGKACFSSIQVKTRSSQSFTATLKDFTLSHFQDCVATIATQIHDGPTVGATHVAPDIQIGKGRGTINVGDTIHDKAIVTGQAAFPTPTGSVKFFRYDNGDCSGTPANGTNGETATITQILAPTPSAGGQAAAESLAFKAALSGAVSFQALYLGDSNYIRVTPPSECEVVIINKLPSRIITDILLNGTNSSVLNRTLAVGSTVVDEATVYGLGGTGIDPTGSVTFARFANANCSGTAALTETKQITADGAADGIARVRSSAYSASNAGGELVCFKATYSGDNVYLPPDNPSEVEPICVFNQVPKPPAPF